MEDRIKELELEIEVLDKRVKHLERIENRRKIISIIKTVIIIVLLGALAISLYDVYQKIMDFYNSFLVHF